MQKDMPAWLKVPGCINQASSNVHARTSAAHVASVTARCVLVREAASLQQFRSGKGVECCLAQSSWCTDQSAAAQTCHPVFNHQMLSAIISIKSQTWQAVQLLALRGATNPVCHHQFIQRSSNRTAELARTGQTVQFHASFCEKLVTDSVSSQHQGSTHRPASHSLHDCAETIGE